MTPGIHLSPVPLHVGVQTQQTGPALTSPPLQECRHSRHDQLLFRQWQFELVSPCLECKCSLPLSRPPSQYFLISIYLMYMSACQRACIVLHACLMHQEFRRGAGSIGTGVMYIVNCQVFSKSNNCSPSLQPPIS